MANPLTSLDELIWNQFEKVTQYAHKNYGWDKWDLAHLANWATGASFVGAGIYSFLALNHETSPVEQAVDTTFGILGLTIGMAAPYAFNKLNQYHREAELDQLIHSRSVKRPQFSWKRPLFMYFGILTMTIGDSYLQGETLLNKTTGLATLCFGFSYEFSEISNYFSTQFPKPPSTKKPFWKTTYEGIKNKFQPKPQLEPAAEPIAKYAAEQRVLGH